MTRLRTPLALALLLCVLAPSARAQSRTLDELESARDRAHLAWTDAVVALQLADRELTRLRGRIQALNAELADLRRQPSGLLVDRQNLHQLSDQTVLDQRSRDSLARQEQLELEEYISASHAFAARLFVVAERDRRNGREDPAADKVQRALEELDRLQDLERLVATAPDDTPGEADEFLDMLRDVRDPDELDDFAAYFRGLGDLAERQLERLAPRAQRLDERLRHLEVLQERGYTIPDLERRLQDTHTRLARLQSRRDAAQADLATSERGLAMIDQLRARFRDNR